MSTFAKTEVVPEPTGVRVTGDKLSVDLADGRTIVVPWNDNGTAIGQIHAQLITSHANAGRLGDYFSFGESAHAMPPAVDHDVVPLCGEFSKARAPQSLDCRRVPQVD